MAGDLDEDMTQDMSYEDMSIEDMPDAPGDMLGGYRAALADLGPVPMTCSTAISKLSASSPDHTARVFVPSIALTSTALSSHWTWRTSLQQMIHQHVAPCQQQGISNVVILPQAVATAALLIGPKATQAREQSSPSSALAAMTYTLERAQTFYQNTYPDLSLAQGLILGATDGMGHMIYDTYVQLARAYKIWLIAPYYGAPFEWTTDAEVRAQISDADIQDPNGAYVATSDDVAMRQLVIAPSGEIVANVPRLRHSQIERVLQLKDRDLSALGVVSIEGLGRVAWTAQAESIEPDVLAQLDALGVQTIIQGGPSRRWTANTQGIWTPDQSRFNSWYPTQVSTSLRRVFAPQMQVQLVDLPFSAQAHVVEPAITKSGPSRFLGQWQALYGMSWVDNWVLPNSNWVDLPADLLRDVLDALPIGDWQHTTSVHGFDVFHPDTEQLVNQARAVETIHGIRVIHTLRKNDRTTLMLKRFEQGTLKDITPIDMVGGQLRTPSMVAGKDGLLHLAAEFWPDVQPNGAPTSSLVYMKLDPKTGMIIGQTKLATSGDVYQPHLISQGAILHLAWIEATPEGKRARYTQTSLPDAAKRTNAPFANTIIKTLGQLSAGEHQWSVRLSIEDKTIVAVWMQRSLDGWSVVMTTSTDAGLSWKHDLPLTTSVVEHINHLSVISDQARSFRVAWSGHAIGETNTHIDAVAISIDRVGVPNVTQSVRIQPDSPKWVTQPVWDAQGKSLIYTVLEQEKTRFERVHLDTQQGLMPIPLGLNTENRDGKLHVSVPVIQGQDTYLLYTKRNPRTLETTVTLQLAR